MIMRHQFRKNAIYVLLIGVQTHRNDETTENNGLRGIGGRQETIRVVTIQIPFSGLPVFIYIEFLILSANDQTLLYMKDMCYNGMEIRIKARKIYSNTHSPRKIISLCKAGNQNKL